MGRKCFFCSQTTRLKGRVPAHFLFQASDQFREGFSVVTLCFKLHHLLDVIYPLNHMQLIERLYVKYFCRAGKRSAQKLTMAHKTNLWGVRTHQCGDSHRIWSHSCPSYFHSQLWQTASAWHALGFRKSQQDADPRGTSRVINPLVIPLLSQAQRWQSQATCALVFSV